MYFFNLAYYNGATDDDDTLRFWIGFGGPVILFVGYFLFLYFRKRKDNLSFRAEFSPEGATWSHIHLILAAELMRRDRVQLSEKAEFARRYILHYFPDRPEEFSENLFDYMRNPEYTKEAFSWIREQQIPDDHLLKLMRFLQEVCLIDGEMVPEEYRALMRIGQLVGLSASGLQEFAEQFQQQEQAKKQREAPAADTSVSKRKLAFGVLGLPEDSDDDALRTQYRKLVKIYHPDRVRSRDPKHIKEAELRFIEIQQAYDLLRN